MTGVSARPELEEELGIAVKRVLGSNCPKVSKGVFVCGPQGSGKTHFVLTSLRRLGYEPMCLSAGQGRNKDAIESLAAGNIAERSVISMFHGAGRPVVVVLDDVDCLGAGGTDKGAVPSLVRLIRAQKSKRQMSHPRAANPVVCIGGLGKDKKTKEIAAACGARVELGAPSAGEASALAARMAPGLSEAGVSAAVGFANGDLHQLRLACGLLRDQGSDQTQMLTGILPLDGGQDSRGLAAELLRDGCSISDHRRRICDVDRSMVGLTLHENIARLMPDCLGAPYREVADRFAEADCLDRTGFQRQVSQLNELSSILKNVCTAAVLNAENVGDDKLNSVCEDTRFTRVLTKYSSQFSNLRFIQAACARTGLDRRGLHRHWARHAAGLKGAAGNELRSLAPLEISRLERYFAPYARGCA